MIYKNQIIFFALMVILTAALGSFSDAQENRKKTITRIFWQDLETQKLSYADLSTTDRWHIKRGWVKEFPILNEQNDSLGPMVQIGKQLAVAINAASGSKIVRIDSGVVEEPHGNHFHWKYPTGPRVDLVLSTERASTFAMAIVNDFYFCRNLGGFVRLNSSAVSTGNNPAYVYSAGGDRMSLAVTTRSTAYATHGDSEGDKSGRVDVINLVNPSPNPISFKLPVGQIFSSTASNGKVFFAHDKGISWVAAATSFDGQASAQPISNIVPATQSPSALMLEQSWVLFSAGQGRDSALCMINSATSNPQLVKLPIPSIEGLSLSTPKTKLSLGKRYAFLFQERVDSSSNIPEKLIVVDLDPNRDLDFSDAAIKSTIAIGSSKIAGEEGHHQICFDAYGRFAIYTDPGDGILSIVTINDMKVRAKFRVNGIPSRILAVGAPEHFH